MAVIMLMLVIVHRHNYIIKSYKYRIIKYKYDTYTHRIDRHTHLYTIYIIYICVLYYVYCDFATSITSIVYMYRNHRLLGIKSNKSYDILQIDTTRNLESLSSLFCARITDCVTNPISAVYYSVLVVYPRTCDGLKITVNYIYNYFTSLSIKHARAFIVDLSRQM